MRDTPTQWLLGSWSVGIRRSLAPRGLHVAHQHRCVEAAVDRIGDLEINEDIAFQEREWKVERVGWRASGS